MSRQSKSPAGIYVRISSDPEGKRLGVTRQLEDCRRKARALGWKVAATYQENDMSASNGKPRPEYERMMSDLESGRIGAVVVWDLDRLTRRPIELESFIDLADRRGVALASVGGDVDLATEAGRLHARIMGAVARHEVEHKGARQARAYQQLAEKGAPHPGMRTFGYARGGREIVKEEAREIQKAAEAVLAGVSIRGIARDWNKHGIKTSQGSEWRPSGVRRVLSNPRYAGLRVYQGEIIDTPGDWQPILDVDTFYAVRAMLNQPDRRRPGRPRRYLLSGLALCDVCDGKMYGLTDKRRGTCYRCETRKHVHRRAEPVEEYVEQVVIARLSRDDARDLFTREDQADEVAALRDEETALRSRLDGLAEAYAAGEIDRRQLRAGTKRIDARLEEIDQALAATTREPVLSEIVTAEDVAEVWSGLDLDRKRAVIATLMEVRLASPGVGSRPRHFDPDTVSITWKS